MKILILGCNGQLGSDMLQLLQSTNNEIRGIDYPEIDLTDQTLAFNCIMKHSPNIIINCIAYTAVDLCETNQSIAYALNADALHVIGTASQKLDAFVIHFSTDYVFDGFKTQPYIENDPTNPQSVYGKSKLAGEMILKQYTEKYCILRIAWLYGLKGSNFVKKIHALALQRIQEKKPLTVINDQFGTPTFTRAVCRQTLELLKSESIGLFHATNEGACNWYDFAQTILSKMNVTVELVPCSTAQFSSPAHRPAYSVLENHNLKQKNLNIMPDWHESFNEFIFEYSKCT